MSVRRKLWVTGGGRQVAMYYRYCRTTFGAPRAAARLMTAGYATGIRAERDRINRGADPGTVAIRTFVDDKPEWSP